jgi:hypothetical protein
MEYQAPEGRLMKVKIPHFMIVEGVRLKAGTEYTVDKSLDIPVDKFGRRISKKTYDKHFKPAPTPKAKAKAEPKEEPKPEKED